MAELGSVVRGTKDFQVPEYFNFADVIDEWAQKEKEGKRKSNYPALWWIDGAGSELKWSFQDVAINSKKAANVLCTAADIKPGDRVMAILPTIPEYWLMQVACLRTGGAFVIMTTNIGPKELHQRILKSKPVCVVAAPCDQVNSELLDVVDQMSSSGEVNLRSKIVVNRMQKEQRKGWLSFEDLFQAASADYQSVKSLSSATTNIYHTSGTTGNSKMAEHSQASTGLGSAGMRKTIFAETDLNWTATPTGWSVLAIRGFFSAWSVGSGAFAHYKKVSTREALETLQKYPITHAQFRPSIYMEALNEGILKSFSFSKLKRCFVAGEPANAHMISRWKEETGVELWNFYGQTEMNELARPSEPGNGSRPASVGKPLPGVDMLSVDDNFQEVPPGTLGRVVIRVKPYCPVGMFIRYVDEPEKTAACFSGDFYVTGDLGRMDAEGYFWVVGRADDMIFYNALNVNPYEVENSLKAHPAVLDCAVVSIPKMMLQTIKAFIVLSSGFKDKNQDEMIKELQEHVIYNTAEWMCPERMEFVEDLPRTPAGKWPRSCFDLMKSGVSSSGYYYIRDNRNKPFRVFCDLASEPGWAWTLVMSQSFRNRRIKQLMRFPLYRDAPLNVSNPNWDAYRLSLQHMEELRAESSHWRATCSFPTDVFDYRDYVRGNFSQVNLISLEGDNVCKKVDYMNVKGRNCTDCTVAWWQNSGSMFHNDLSYGKCFFETFIKAGSVSNADYFGWYENVDRSFPCCLDDSSTTNHWFGAHV